MNDVDAGITIIYCSINLKYNVHAYCTYYDDDPQKCSSVLITSCLADFDYMIKHITF